MTSRTPMGVQPRPPQRTLSSSSLGVQRPQPQPRSLSQQYPPQYAPRSPVRRDSSLAVDLTNDSADVAQPRHALTPRRGGSRLRLELSSDIANLAAAAAVVESPQGLTPSSRLLTLSDAADGGNQSPALSRTSGHDADNPPMPMPQRRPRASRPPARRREPTSAPAPTKKDVRLKPYAIETPPAAPRYLPASRHDRPHRDPFSKGLYSGYADFFPWTGKHHEDEWNSDAITKGTWDKGNQTESSSARLAISPALKQKGGLNALSTVFMGVLNQRRHRGHVSVPSTFKPPPRVTLTDTKREIWLKDLANPSTPLRRLSRTIPHGIRGRVLLDQCLNKNVPTERAVWLAKCVGANEIRATKRKGVNGAFAIGGELKWSKDWTVFVEQFVDSVVSSFGEADWKAKVTYAIRLATSLYSEYLLDRDHYLDWLMSGLENSPQSKLPMWILIAQIYWPDLLASRKYGRRLVLTMLSHLNTMYKDPDGDIVAPLSHRVSSLLKVLLTTNPESFVCPRIWPKYRDVLKSFISTDDEAALMAYASVDSRNAKLLVTSASASPNGRKHFVKLLDTTMSNNMDPELSTKCWATSDNKTDIVRTLVEWATSFHRPGLAKVYTAANLIRAWSTLRFDSTAVILDILDGVAPSDTARKELFYHLVTELVRTRHFSVPQYMRWLIARGGYCDASEIDPSNGPCAMRMLIELPLHCFPDRWKIERGSLLRRAGDYSIASECEDIENALKCVKQTLGLPLPPGDPMAQRKPIPLRKLLTMIGASSKALRSSVGAGLRDALAGQPATDGEFVMPLSMFTSIRTILESTEDFSMLSDVLKACSKASNPEILACCVDTVNTNLAVFLAMGSAADLFNLFIERLKLVSQDNGLLARPLLAALAFLAQRIPGMDKAASQLHHDLLQIDRTNPSDACSPVSDNMVTQMQSAEGEISEEIEKLLGSGNSIDPQTMSRVFQTVVPRLEEGWVKLDESRRIYASLLTRLRVFDTKHFDKLMADWVCHIRSLQDRPSLHELFPLLASLGCLTVKTLLNTASASPSTQDEAADSGSNDAARHGSAIYLQELLQLLLTTAPTTELLTPEELYRFRIHQQSAKTEYVKPLLALIRSALLEYSGIRAQSGHTDLPLDSVACQDSVLETLRLLVVIDSSSVANALTLKELPAEATDLISKITNKLLVAGDEGGSGASFDHVLESANDLTMPFCQLKLNMDLSMAQSTATGGEELAPSRFDLFAKAMDRAIEANNIMWTSMLPCLSDDITQHLKSQAYAKFLELLPSPKDTDPSAATSIARARMAENLLGVLEAILAGQPPPRSAQLTSTLVEKLSDLWDILAAGDDGDAGLQAAVLEHWLPALLRCIALHNRSSEPVAFALPSAPASGKATIPPHQEARARITLLLCGLLLELECWPGATTRALPQHVFDSALQLVDALPEDLRAHCARATLLLPGAPTASAGVSSDPRLYYLLSAHPPTAADNLMLARRDKTPSAMVRGIGAMYGIGPASRERLNPFALKRWELLSESTPNVGENDTSLSLGLFGAIKIH